MSRLVSELDLSVRATNCLKNQGIKTIGQLIKFSEVELLAWPNLGKSTLSEISSVLAQYGLSLGKGCRDEPVQQQLLPIGLSAPSATEAPSPTSVAPDLKLLFWFKAFPEREQAVIRSRIVNCTATLEVLGQKFDVTRERIRQIEKRLSKKIHRFVASPEGQTVRALAQRFRSNLGAAFPVTSLSTHFSMLSPSNELMQDREFVAAFFLWIAGPYLRWTEWMTIAEDLASKTKIALGQCMDGRGWVSPEAASIALSDLDIRADHQGDWLRTLGFFEIDGGWLPRLRNIPDRVEQILRYRGVPVTAEDLFSFVECESERSLRNRLLEDRRFKRTSKQAHFALREWPQYDEYSGIAEEIAEEIERQGGVAQAQHLVDVISNRYGVKPNSVYQYLHAPMFIKIEQGRVRLRASHEIPSVRAEPYKCPGLYLVDNQWTLRVLITPDVLRGSGRPVHPAVAALMGCQPGERCVFRSPQDEIVISWPLGSAAGPSLGSLRPDVEALDGKIGDFVFLVLGRSEIGVHILRASDLASANADVKLSLLIGFTAVIASESERWNAIACAIGLPSQQRSFGPEDIHAGFMRRNEVALARIIKDLNPEDSKDIFAQLENTLGL